MKSTAEYGILTNRPELLKRVTEICTEFQYTFAVWDSVDAFLEADAAPKILIAAINEAGGPIAPAELAQVVRQICGDAYLLCVAPGSLTKEAASFAKKSGADLILLEDEVLTTGKLEFISTQILRSKFLPIKVSDLAVNHALGFDLFHLLPQRGKFLQMAFKDDLLDQTKYERAREIGELYIERGESKAFSEYIKATSDSSAAGIEKRCRSQFLALFSGFSRLAFKLTNQTEYITFDEGKALITECANLCAGLQKALSESGEPWKVINNSAIGEFGSVERAPAIAAYCGVFAMKMGWNAVSDVMLAAILGDLGLLFQPTITLKNIRDEKTSKFTKEELESYRQYPQMSVSLILDRKLQLQESVKTWILTSQERCDGKGFPKGVEGNRLQIQARLIHFCRDFDRRTLLRIGSERPDPKKIFQTMIRDEPLGKIIYGDDLLSALTAAA